MSARSNLIDEAVEALRGDGATATADLLKAVGILAAREISRNSSATAGKATLERAEDAVYSTPPFEQALALAKAVTGNA